MSINDELSGASQLRTLVRLISEKVEDVIAQYSKAGQDVPSLDYLGTAYYDVVENRDEDFIDTLQTIEAACAQLTLTVANPSRAITNVSLILLLYRVPITNS